jgi:hypothetical protein
MLWGGWALGAPADPLSGNVFWSRPCAGLISAFLQTHAPLQGRKRRIVPESVELSARHTLDRLVKEVLHSSWQIDQNPSLLADSKHVSRGGGRNVAERMGSLRNAVGDRATLIGQLDGRERVESFVELFRDHTTAFVDTCQKPSAYREKEMQGYLGQAVCAATGFVSLAALMTNASGLAVAGSAALSALSALYFPLDFPWTLARARDGTDRESATLPSLFDTAEAMLSGRADAPEWLHWGTSTRFSIDSLNELWHRGYGTFIAPELQKAMELDDTIRTLPFVERMKTWWRGRGLERHNPAAYEQLLVQAYGPEVLFDFILLKAGTLGFPEPRLIVAFRLPPHVNEDGGDGGGGRKRPRRPTPAPEPSSNPVPQLVH